MRQRPNLTLQSQMALRIIGANRSSEKEAQFRGVVDRALPKTVTPACAFTLARFAITPPERDVAALDPRLEIIRSAQAVGAEILDGEIGDLSPTCQRFSLNWKVGQMRI